MKPYKAYLFDFDGTLIDTTELIYQCFRYTSKRFRDKDVTRTDVIPNIGYPLRAGLELHLGPLTDEEYSEMAAAHMDFQYRVYHDYVKIIPGVKETLAWLRSHDRRMAIVTSRRLGSLQIFLGDMGIRDSFEALVTPELTEHHKPDPAPVLKALELLDVKKPDAIMIGDSIFDIRAACRAGVDSAFVLFGGNDPATFDVTPTYVLGAMQDLCV